MDFTKKTITVEQAIVEIDIAREQLIIDISKMINKISKENWYVPVNKVVEIINSIKWKDKQITAINKIEQNKHIIDIDIFLLLLSQMLQKLRSKYDNKKTKEGKLDKKV